MLNAVLKDGTTIYHAVYTFLFGLTLLNFPVNSYGHVGTISSPNHTFFWASLTKGSALYF